MSRESNATENNAEDDRAPRTTKHPLSMIALGGLLLALPVVVWGLQKQSVQPSDVDVQPVGVPARPTRLDVLKLPELIALDDMVQKRMSVVPDDGSFGITRMDRSAPISAGEALTMAQIKKAGLQVAFYTVGRRVTNRKAQWGHFVEARGPIMLTDGPLTTSIRGHKNYNSAQIFSVPAPHSRSRMPVSSNWPVGTALEKRTASMLHNDGTPQRWISGRWDIVAVPVLASDQACVDCHNRMLEISDPAEKFHRKEAGQSLQEWAPLKVGDVAGVAIYAYRRSDKAS